LSARVRQLYQHALEQSTLDSHDLRSHASRTGCALKKLSDGSKSLCVVEGFQKNALNATLYKEYSTCTDNTNFGESFSTSCSDAVTTVDTLTGCTIQCALESNLNRNVACSKALNSKCEQTQVPKCPQWYGKPDDYGAASRHRPRLAWLSMWHCKHVACRMHAMRQCTPVPRTARGPQRLGRLLVTAAPLAWATAQSISSRAPVRAHRVVCSLRTLCSTLPRNAQPLATACRLLQMGQNHGLLRGFHVPWRFPDLELVLRQQQHAG
jgi:hypothetical protein